MTDDGSSQGTSWPLAKFYFEAEWEGKVVRFQEVTGLDKEEKAIQYRHGDSKVFAPIKMPGIAKLGSVTLKKVLFPAGDSFWAWSDSIKLNTVQRETVTIRLMEETGKPKLVWTLTNAFPTKIMGTDLRSQRNEVAVETLEFAYESLTLGEGNG